jgi:hypothetical protein
VRIEMKNSRVKVENIRTMLRVRFNLFIVIMG